LCSLWLYFYSEKWTNKLCKASRVEKVTLYSLQFTQYTSKFFSNHWINKFFSGLIQLLINKIFLIAKLMNRIFRSQKNYQINEKKTKILNKKFLDYIITNSIALQIQLLWSTSKHFSNQVFGILFDVDYREKNFPNSLQRNLE